MNPIRIFGEYFYLRQRLPIFVYLSYLHFRKTDSPTINKIIDVLVNFVALVFSYALAGFMVGIPFSTIIPFDWQYAGLLTWGLFFFIYYHKSLEITHHMLTSFTISILATVGGGWLYEISFWHPLSMFISHYSMFYLDGQVICLLLLAYEFKRMNFESNKYISIMFSFFMIFSIVLFIDRSIIMRLFGDYHRYVYRVPASLFLISLLSGVRYECS